MDISFLSDLKNERDLALCEKCVTKYLHLPRYLYIGGCSFPDNFFLQVDIEKCDHCEKMFKRVDNMKKGRNIVQ